MSFTLEEPKQRVLALFRGGIAQLEQAPDQLLGLGDAGSWTYPLGNADLHPVQLHIYSGSEQYRIAHRWAAAYLMGVRWYMLTWQFFGDVTCQIFVEPQGDRKLIGVVVEARGDW